MSIREAFSTETISDRIAWMSQAISADYKGKPLTIIPILSGAFIFASDLVRSLSIADLYIDFFAASSYDENTYSTGKVHLFKHNSRPVMNRHVLIVEDIIDTGYTIKAILDSGDFNEALSVKVCSLLHKPSRSRVEVPTDYVGFTVGDEFYVGYGMDHAGKYRNMPYIGTLAP